MAGHCTSVLENGCGKSGHRNPIPTGNAFKKGEDVAVDLTEAAKWYGMAAENENAEAQFYMANAYSAGTGVKQDDEKAANWYRQAAEQGHGQAQLDYADCCFEGKGRPSGQVRRF